MESAEPAAAAVSSARLISRSVGAKLFTLLLSALLLVFGALGFANVRLHRRHLEAATADSAERMNDVIKRTAVYYMMKNDRDALYQLIDRIGREPGIVRLRILNEQGRISFSSDRSEVGRMIDRKAEGCGMCHSPEHGGVLPRFDESKRFRIYRAGGQRVLAIATPIMNAPSCSSAACHAHEASRRVLGLLDADLSLASTDANLSSGTNLFVLYSAIGIVVTLLLSALFVWRFVHKPVKVLRVGTRKLAQGELGVQIPVSSSDELGVLARSFNDLSRQLQEARKEITAWTRTLEARVEEKTAALRSAHEQMLHAEKLTSLGKLAAVVAHEINNPLSGILTYAKLLRKWVDRGEKLEARTADMREALQLIESESRRCGDIVSDLLTFARAAPLNIAPVDVNDVIRRCLRLVEHKLELGNILTHAELPDDAPRARGDASQIEQLLLALIMNAIEAMPREGNLHLATAASPDGSSIVITVEDNGVGIPPEMLPRLFEPFVTTKEHQKGVGLGLAISCSIVERHNGQIKVKSEVGRGTTFTITLPAIGAAGEASETAGQAVAAAAGGSST
jgi:two-component system NtrC family sensor kinase